MLEPGATKGKGRGLRLMCLVVAFHSDWLWAAGSVGDALCSPSRQWSRDPALWMSSPWCLLLPVTRGRVRGVVRDKRGAGSVQETHRVMA